MKRRGKNTDPSKKWQNRSGARDGNREVTSKFGVIKGLPGEGGVGGPGFCRIKGLVPEDC